MNRKQFVLFLLLIFTGLALQAQRNCGTMDHLEQQIQKDPGLIERMESIENHTRKFLAEGAPGARQVVSIPVVVHVVYNTSVENISDNQILSQIQVLNDDFRRLNSDADNTWPQAADVEVEFCLATIDPAGGATSGITRTSTSVTSFSTNDAMKFNSSGGHDAWPAGDYLNIWVCDLSGGLLGYAQFPGGNASTDGVVIDYQYFGTTGTATAPFDLGRTATHEVGHWLNLRHIWGDGGCSVDDFVSDTPLSDAANYGCSIGHESCGTVDMVQNYMDYSDDACMNLFTLGQKNRMQALFSPGGDRYSLLSSNGCGSAPAPTCDDGIQNGQETGIDCGGPDCPPCQSGCSQNELVLTLNFDNYPEETSWALIDAGGTPIESGGTYGNQPDGSTLIINLCVPDGCYDFIIYYSYGDGICCGYGNGSYSLEYQGSVLASGGSFGSSETTNFCLNTSQPTCDDGIQNGQETGVDCGGPDCLPCPSCDDGIQNGQETGVDCGGPDCPACPTCDDGVQNGEETGVDCGGPDCPPCQSACIENEVTLTLVLDNYPEETSWVVTDASGSTVASGGTYGSQPDGSTVMTDLCLPDGCYDFTIYDSYGDGICCTYGNGSYSLVFQGSLLASGGSFGSSETTSFCLGIVQPTCDDGIQNGQETGVDCGGPDCPPCSTNGSEVVFGHYFESGWDGWADGGSDCSRYAGSRSWEGNYSILIRDNSGIASSMTSPLIDATPYSSLEIEFYFYAYSMEAGEDFWLRYFDGSTWSTIAAYARGSEFENNNFYVATVTLDNGSYNFPANAQFRFQCDASGNQDQIYIDAVTVTGYFAGSRWVNTPQIALVEAGKEEQNHLNEELTVFPNPVTHTLSILPAGEVHGFEILDVTGKVMLRSEEFRAGEIKVDVAGLPEGMYFLRVDYDGEFETTRFVKNN
jgi:hypothetical protein